MDPCDHLKCAWNAFHFTHESFLYKLEFESTLHRKIATNSMAIDFRSISKERDNRLVDCLSIIIRNVR